jgi:hypothetical protein
MPLPFDFLIFVTTLLAAFLLFKNFSQFNNFHYIGSVCVLRFDKLFEDTIINSAPERKVLLL